MLNGRWNISVNRRMARPGRSLLRDRNGRGPGRDYEAAWKTLQQALKLIGDHPASYTLGRIYANMAGVCWFLKRPRKAFAISKRRSTYYERTDHKTSAANGYNNLGINLILIGQWGRAQEALQRALSLASEADERGDKVPMILDSLGELLHAARRAG